MLERAPARHGLGAFASAVTHAGIALILLALPAEPPELDAQIDLEIERRAQPPPPPPPPEPPPPEEPPPPPEPVKAPRIRRPTPAPEPPPPEPPPEEPPPPDAPTEPPVFNMDSSSFSAGGSFSMPAGPGNTRFGPVGKLRNPAARPTRPAGVPGGTGTGFAAAPPTRVARGARVVREVRAPYPEQARDAGIEGVVLLQVEVTRTGTIHSVRVLTDPGYGLGSAAARALRAFRFAPAVDGGGQPIDSRFTYTYRFELDDF